MKDEEKALLIYAAVLMAIMFFLMVAGFVLR